MRLPSAVRIKETVVSWRHLTVVTAELPDKNLLRRYSVFVADEAGVPVSLEAHFATAGAADHEHQRLAKQLATGAMPKECLV
jgi:hypothetical protein